MPNVGPPYYPARSVRQPSGHVAGRRGRRGRWWHLTPLRWLPTSSASSRCRPGRCPTGCLGRRVVVQLGHQAMGQRQQLNSPADPRSAHLGTPCWFSQSVTAAWTARRMSSPSNGQHLTGQTGRHCGRPSSGLPPRSISMDHSDLASCVCCWAFSTLGYSGTLGW